MKNTRPQLWKRSLACLLTVQMALAPLEPALAQATKLADEPIGFSPQAAPNIVLTVDDSTSMLADFLPDFVVGSVPGSAGPVGGFCRDSAGEMKVPCGSPGAAGSTTSSGSPPYIYSAGSLPYPLLAAGNPPNALPYLTSAIPDWMRAWPAPVHSNALNRLYYDPAITYSPPLNYDGTAYANQTTFNSVVADPWASPLKYSNLTSNVTVGMWCNSDWPVNTNWNPTTGGGAECRVNGTDYSGLVTNKAPADYQYPWNKQSGANDVKYFFRGGAGTGANWRKTLYCDTTSPKWPRVSSGCTTTWSCPAPQTLIPPSSQPQTCVQTGTTTGCTSSTTTYSPAGCNTNPAYGSPGPCVGPECLSCTATTTCTATGPTGKTGACRLSSTLTGGSGAACNCSGASCTLPACPNYVSGSYTCSGASTPTSTTTCSTSPAAASSCGQYLWDPVAKASTTTTLLADSNGAGEVCRHNNQSYGGGPVAAPFNYPAAPFTTPIATATVTNGVSCPTVPATASIPRHYWKTSVEWCVAKVTANNDKWRGFGQPGACQDEHDNAHPYPRFYKYGVAKSDPAYLDNYANPAFERVDLVATTPSYSHTFIRNGAPVTITRTYAEEMTNYSNWFAYYRTRIQAAKTVISQSFSFLDDGYRVGFHTLSNNPVTSFVNVSEFVGTAGGQKDLWYQQLFGIKIKMAQQTPNMDAVVRIGELFKNGSSATLSGATDPIVLSCQKNYHMLFTDGITNQPALPATTVGNVDDIVPALPVALVVTPPIVSGSPWPDLYRENNGASLANTLGDYAMHYWVTDLRPALTNNVVTGRDPASWQHVNFAALSLGTEGTLAGASASVEAQIASGAVKWPTPTPSQFKPNATGVDDLWHAAVNARGRFVNARTPRQLGIGIANILADITSPSGSAAAPTFANPNISATNNFTYIAKFEQGWGGSVQKVRIDPLTAAPVAVMWDAKTQLITQTTPTVPDPTPWFTKRRIVTLNEGGAAVPFLSGNLGPTQLSTLGPDLTYQNRVIAYLRGDRSEEGENDGQFRVRASPLGDIVDSQGVLVGKTDPPINDYWEYLESNDVGYTAFKASQATRPGRIYVGANDGMLHAFDEANGDEVWAFIPRDFYRAAPPVSNDKAGLIGLTYQPGGLPIYDHRFYVNATPRVVDADIGGTWKTLLVGGLGKGGKSYFAIDATDPQTVVDENSAAAKFLWEFRNADLGYTYGRATIVKTRAFGWTVIVPSGYNNLSGEGKLFFINPVDGTMHRPPLSTNVGSAGNPSGLAHIAGFTKDYRNQLVEQVYGGDLFGNLWRFDLSDANDANWVVEKLAVLTDGSTPQPITTPPRIDIDVANGIDRWVFVGTGKLTHACDLADYFADNTGAGGSCVGNPAPTQKQTMYAIRDGTYTTPNPIGTALTRADLDAVSGITGLGSNVIASKGWYDDLNDQPGLPAGRVIRTPVAAVGLIAYIATSEPIDPCEVGLPATIYVRQFGNGESRLDLSGSPVESIYEPTGAAGMDVIAMNPPGCSANCIPDIKLAVLSSSTSQLITFKAKLPGILSERRMSWGTLGQ